MSLELFERCKDLLGVSRPIRLVAANSWSVPTLWGWRKPVLLLPASCLTLLNEVELRLVFLHELAHVKRRDILLNWLMITARSLHWFNPLVWVALRRLRADRELVCDEIVLHLLTPPEHVAYGKTLLKLVEAASSARFCPSLVPVLGNKHEIKRRITMISTYKPAHRLTALATGALLSLVCWITFTRAADAPQAASARTAADAPSSNTSAARTSADGTLLRKRLTELEKRIARQQEKVDRLRIELAPLGSGPEEPTLTPETIRLLERERITNLARAASFQTLYDELKSKSESQLAQAIPTAIPDNELAQLLRDLNTVETQLAKLSQQLGPDHPELRDYTTMRAAVKKQIQARIEGILAGLQAQFNSQMASAAALSNQVQAAQLKDALLAEKYRPYFAARRDLDTLRRLHDALLLKVWTTESGSAEDELP